MADIFMSKMIYESLLEYNRNLPLLTLQELSLIKIITTLCNNEKLRGLILRCDCYYLSNSYKLCFRNSAPWKAVEAMANEMVSQLCKSVLLQKRILEYLWPISYRIIVWEATYASRISKSFLPHFHWTERGRIDNTRTARCLIGNRNIPVRERFALACRMCLQNEIFEIWREMSNEEKEYFYNIDNRLRLRSLSDYWAHIVAETDDVSDDYIGKALSYASREGLLEAVKYLFTLTPENEMEFFATDCMLELISKIVCGHLLEEDEKDITCIVYSHMIDKNREEFLNHSFEAALTLLLHSGKYKLCLNLLEERLKSASVDDIAAALEIIFYTYHLQADKDEECRLLFMDFWRKIPTWMRKAKKLKELRMEFLTVLVRDNFSFLLEKGALQKIAELTSLDLKFNNSDKQVDFHRGKWDFLHFIIQEVITTPLLKMPKTKILSLLTKRQSNYAVCYRMFRFVSKIQRKNPMQRE